MNLATGHYSSPPVHPRRACQKRLQTGSEFKPCAKARDELLYLLHWREASSADAYEIRNGASRRTTSPKADLRAISYEQVVQVCVAKVLAQLVPSATAVFDGKQINRQMRMSAVLPLAFEVGVQQDCCAVGRVMPRCKASNIDGIGAQKQINLAGSKSCIRR
ncbi:hypothetical protein FGB62_180g011 [Gracilaria domingensis]|nr:hypothetical protein FGB62_180g011 [Gracilaria domingensis]